MFFLVAMWIMLSSSTKRNTMLAHALAAMGNTHIVVKMLIIYGIIDIYDWNVFIQIGPEVGNVQL